MTWRNKEECPRCGGQMLKVLCLDCDYSRNIVVWCFTERWPALLIGMALVSFLISLYNVLT